MGVKHHILTYDDFNKEEMDKFQLCVFFIDNLNTYLLQIVSS
jgi:hypothetical protein